MPGDQTRLMFLQLVLNDRDYLFGQNDHIILTGKDRQAEKITPEGKRIRWSEIGQRLVEIGADHYAGKSFDELRLIFYDMRRRTTEKLRRIEGGQWMKLTPRDLLILDILGRDSLPPAIREFLDSLQEQSTSQIVANSPASSLIEIPAAEMTMKMEEIGDGMAGAGGGEKEGEGQEMMAFDHHHWLIDENLNSGLEEEEGGRGYRHHRGKKAAAAATVVVENGTNGMTGNGGRKRKNNKMVEEEVEEDEEERERERMKKKKMVEESGGEGGGAMPAGNSSVDWLVADAKLRYFNEQRDLAKSKRRLVEDQCALAKAQRVESELRAELLRLQIQQMKWDGGGQRRKRTTAAVAVMGGNCKNTTTTNGHNIQPF